ncbi:MAG: hypothetical protein Q8N53_07750, partial [Longimicrobiales bacterium]|nr:hypothetical protein [Longimicrobiales bacterium]
MRAVSSFVCLLAACLALAAPALADVGPPLQPPGSSIAPGGGTRVQMVAERVVLEVLPPPEAGLVRVRAVFTMRNPGDDEERMAVRFPLEDLSGMGDGYRPFPRLVGFVAAADGWPVATRVVEEPGQVDGGEPVSWAVFDVAFPPGEDVEIDVTYETQLTGYHDPEMTGYDPAIAHYILETGAGWDGPIGSADLILRLPYEAGPENVFLEDGTTLGAGFAGHEVRWHWENLEPTRQDEWRARIVWPDDWLRILALRRAVQTQPGDATTWIDLAEAYRGAG